MSQFRGLDVRECLGLLWAICENLRDDLYASFEGDLSGLGLTELPGASLSETTLLKRQTIEPKLDFCVVPVNPETLPVLKVLLARAGALGDDGQVIHVQVAQRQQLVLIACDNFHPECTAVSEAVDVRLLQGLMHQGILRNYDGA